MDQKKEMQAKQAVLADLHAAIDQNIHSWADLYAVFHTKMATLLEQGTKVAADDALLAMYAFVLTLEELPDEGDAAVIAKNMLQIIIMEPERLGATTTVISTEELSRILHLQATEQEVMQDETPSDEPEETRRYLH